MKKRLSYLLLILLAFLFIGCKTEEIKENIVISLIVDEDVYKEITIEKSESIDYYEMPRKNGNAFFGWYVDSEYSEEFDFNDSIENNLALFGHYVKGYYYVHFETGCDDLVLEDIVVKKGDKINKPTNIARENFEVEGFYTDEQLEMPFNFNDDIREDKTIYIKWGIDKSKYCKINFVFNYDEIWSSKEELRKAYYADFYNFLNDQEFDFERYEIYSLDDFLISMDTFTFMGVNEMGGIGNVFGSYYLTIDVGGVIENQPTDTFIGYCYQNNKYRDFISHLETFFAYWRTDEGYSRSDPNGNDFYASNWASMVDTAKFFFFDGDTLNTRNNRIYSWFRSQRVKEALDNIPGVNVNDDVEHAFLGEELELNGLLNIIGYNVECYSLNQDYSNPITNVDKDTLKDNLATGLTIYVELSKQE